jgi:hypothetical protein
MAGTLAIANGGTGATSAQAARNNLLPVQTSNSGFVLTTDGTNVSWANPAGLSNVANGSTGNVQFNNGGALLGVANFNWDNTNKKLQLTTGNSTALEIVGTASTDNAFITFGRAAAAELYMGLVGGLGNVFSNTTAGDFVIRNSVGDVILGYGTTSSALGTVRITPSSTVIVNEALTIALSSKTTTFTAISPAVTFDPVANAGYSISLAGGAGVVGNDASSGAGGSISLAGGAGATTANAGTGGAGGAITLVSGTGGSRTSGTGAGVGGAGGTITLQTGAGGASDTAGPAGEIVMKIGSSEALAVSATKALRVNGSTGSAGQVLTSNGASSAPTWQTFGGIGDMAIFVSGIPTANQLLFKMAIARAVTIPAGATLSQAVAGTAATASYTLSLNKNGVSFGTVNFAASSAVGTFTVASSTTFAAGDVISVVAASTPDTTLADVAITLAVA